MKYLFSRFCLCFSVAVVLTAKGQPVEIIPAGMRGAIQPQAAVAPAGKVFVTFGKGGTVYCAVSADGAKTFSAPQEVAVLPKLALGKRRGPRIAASDQRVAVSAISATDGNLYAWSSEDGGHTWSQAMQVNSVSRSAREGLHTMAGDGRGRVYLAWLDLRNGGMELWGAGSEDGGRSWGQDSLIYRSPDGHICECCHPSVAIGSRGGIRVMWRNWLNGARDMYLSESIDGGRSFGPAAKLGQGTWPLNACPMDGGDLVLTREDAALAVWRRADSVYAGGEKSREQLLGAGQQPVVKVGKGGAYFVWQDGPRLILKKPGAAKPVVLSNAGAYPVIVAASSGTGPVVFWEAVTNGTKTILAEVMK